MSTTTHPVSAEEIMAFLDGELSADRAQSVFAHKETCAGCQSVAEGLQQTKNSIASWQVAALPEAIENRIQSTAAKVPTLSDTSTPETFRRLSFWPWKYWLAGLATAAAVGVILYILTPYRSVLYSRSSDRAIGSLEIEARSELKRREAMARPLTTPSSSVTSGSDKPDYSNAWTFSLGRDSATNALPPAKPSRKPQTPSQVVLPSFPMIARTVSLSLVTKDFPAARSSLDAILFRHGGYAANLTVSTPEDAGRSIQASLRIPAPQLAAALDELKSLGRVELENQNGEEVTQQHADLVARLKNSRETEQRLQAILTQRTGKISDVLEVEQEIARVRGEIEQMEAEQKNLEHRVDFATIDLKLSEEYKAKLDPPAASISTQIHNAGVNGYRNVADTLLSILLFFAEYGPVLCFWLLVLGTPAWLVRRRWRQAAAI
jgi:Domain of unknown function (DUF4349)/Putative zinc-finger